MRGDSKIGFHIRMDEEVHRELIKLKKLMEDKMLIKLSLNDFLNLILKREVNGGKKSKAS